MDHLAEDERVPRSGAAQASESGAAAEPGRSGQADSAKSGSKPTVSQVADLLPHVALPKGGGAIHGIGEKFSVNSANGTAAISIPLALSPGRSGFTPRLGLAYDSGSGNGPFGFGWSLSIPSITRKTDKGLPRYGDARWSLFATPNRPTWPVSVGSSRLRKELDGD